MRRLTLIIITFMFCVSCGVKDDPKYQTQYNFDKKIKVI